MRIVFISNFFNHHQKPFSDSLFALTEGQYCFVAVGAVPEERKQLGYSEQTSDYVLHYQDRKDADEVRRRIADADVILSGLVGEELLADAKKDGKLIFRFSERPLKNGFEPLKYPYRQWRWRRANPRFARIYLLCAGAYTAVDYAAFGMFQNKMYKWGYFPACVRYPDIRRLLASKQQTDILWCGRFLDWKHPDDVLKAASLLLRDAIPFHIRFVGTGVMEDTLRRYCREHGLTEHVSFLGAMSPDLVRRQMETAGIFLLTSDKKEGWGAVLNEAMNSACAVIASQEAGSVPYLINNNTNGLVFRSGDIDSLYQKIRYLLRRPAEQQRLGNAAYQTITEEWNAETAAERFVKVCEALRDNREISYASGPCSRAETKIAW